MFTEQKPQGRDYKLSDSPVGAHAKIIKYAGAKKKVLDVGCGSGYLSQEFKNNGCLVYAIESDPQRAQDAKKIVDDLLVADIETLKEMPYKEGFFDVIVLADILEHLRRPDLVLLNLKRYLSRSGRIIVSVPNIARIDIRIRLLFGNFNYCDGGILDRTHLRFFTYPSIVRLMKECGYRIELKDFTGYLSQYRIFRPMAGLWAFQFILVAGISD